MTDDARHRRKPWLTAIKVVMWTVMAIVLFVVAVSVCAVKMLTPDVLTPVANRVAGSVLDADVSIGRVELSLKNSYPMLCLTVDSVAVCPQSHKIRNGAGRELPQWADTLVSFSRFRGDVNIFSIARGIIDLGNFELHRPRVNLLIVNDSVNNYTIFRPSPADTDTASASIPDVRLRSFRLVDPQPLRFVNMIDTIDVTATFTAVSIAGNKETGRPAYRIDFGSDIDSPAFDFFGLENLPVSFTGDIFWQVDSPYRVRISDMAFDVLQLGGKLNTAVDFNNRLLIESFSLDLNPVSVADALASVPDSVKRRYSIPSDIITDAEMSLSASLSAPYDLATEDLPLGRVAVKIDTCMFRWGNVDLRKFAFDVDVSTDGPKSDDLTVDVKRLLLKGPATSLDIACRLSRLGSDPLFDGRINGTIVLDRLPTVLKNLIPGSLSGKVDADAAIKGRTSMFTPSRFHKLFATGNVRLRNVRYEAADTITAAQVHYATIHLGTSGSYRGEKVTIDSLLSAKITVDSATIVQSDVVMRIADLTLGAAVSNRASSADTTTITPLGGRLHTGMFSVFTLTDTAGMRLRGLDGTVALVPLKADRSLPRLMGNLEIDRISVGDRSTRFMVSNSTLKVRANPIPDSPSRLRRKVIVHTADSLRKAYPDLPPDSIKALALARHRRGRHRHAHPEADSMDLEVIDWGASKSMRRLLTEWDINGGLTADRARLFTSAFPVRNRVRNFNIRFNTDTVTLDNVEYKAGHSDFLISGQISNLRRALASRRHNQSLKLRFDMVSDTVDVNELANAVFTGAGNAGRSLGADNFDDESALDRNLIVEEAPDTVGPLLIPTNIDGEFNVRANNVLYSDLLLHNLRGSVLAFDGGLNLHELSASSAVGAVNLSALYSAPSVDRMQFGFGLKLNKFNISQFVRLVPAVDSLMPLMRDFSGVVSANIAATTPVDRQMNFDLSRLHAAIKVEGDSLTVIDPETFRTMAKWLFFKNKHKNRIDHMSAEMLVENGMLEIFPFMFDFDRYRIGVQGSNDMDMNLNYHVSVLKSPLPFRFGINITGNIDKMKIRLGKARFNEKQSAGRVAIVDTTRVNLLKEIENVFRRGVRNSKFADLKISRRPQAATVNLADDTISHADSLYLINEGLLPQKLDKNAAD